MHRLKKLGHSLYNRFALKPARGAIGIGLIGIGGWGISNAVNIMRSRRFTIKGVYDIQENLARKFAERYKTTWYSTLSDLLADTAIDAVCITVPNPSHKELVLAAADAGKHIFIEKPLASHPDECRNIGQYCANRQVVLQVGHQLRREPVFREIKCQIESGKMGPPLFAQGVYTLDRRNREDWRRDPNSCPGGSMEQLGVHLLDVLFFLLGSPIETQGWRRSLPTCSDKADWDSVMLYFPGNVCANISTSFSCPKYMNFELFFEQGWLATNGKILSVSGKDGKSQIYRPRGEKGSIYQFIEFADCIEKGRMPETGACQAEILMKAVQSILPFAGQKS